MSSSIVVTPPIRGKSIIRVSLTQGIANLVKVLALVASSGGTTWLATLYSLESHFFPQTLNSP
jgi:hypothetical protein